MSDPRLRAIHFDQGMIHRGAMAMRENFSNDVYALARIALEAALPNEAELRKLLADRPKPAFRPKKKPGAEAA